MDNGTAWHSLKKVTRSKRRTRSAKHKRPKTRLFKRVARVRGTRPGQLDDGRHFRSRPGLHPGLRPTPNAREYWKVTVARLQSIGKSDSAFIFVFFVHGHAYSMTGVMHWPVVPDPIHDECMREQNFRREA